MKEVEWLKKISTYLGKELSNEDCATIKFGNRYLIFTTDALVEGVHFSFSYYSYYDVGYKLGAVNLSDIAAGGGSPLWALLTLGTKTIDTQAFSFLEGLKHSLEMEGACLIGGDTVKSPVFFCSLTLIGETSYPLLRKGASPGDLIFVSRPLGESSAFLRLIKEKKLEQIPDNLKKAHLKPSPEIKLGKALSEFKIPSATIDISDGLVIDLFRICEEKEVGAILWEEKIPIGPWATLEDALFGGEDYALLFTVPKEKIARLKVIEKSLNRKLFCIGEIIQERNFYLQKDKTLKPLQIRGFDHFLD